ncbi:MAG: hypothetical protein V1659_04510 [Candidatus Woesearchaeota archaeon]
MASTFRETIIFFEQLGVYDVILPFLLVFCIVFALLEKSKILGLEKKVEFKGGETKEGPLMTRRNLNAMVAFVMAFFVVASTKLVGIINQTLAHVVLLLLLSFCFLLLVGSFSQDKKNEAFYLSGPWKTGAEIVMAIGIILIFLNAIGWLNSWYSWVVKHWDGTTFMTIAFLAVIIFAVVSVVRGSGAPDQSAGSESKGKDKKEGAA